MDIEEHGFSLRRRKRREQPFTPDEVLAMEKAASPTGQMTWTSWISVQDMARRLGLTNEAVLKMVSVSKRCLLFKGWSIPKHGDQESRWIAFSHDPAECLIKYIGRSA